MSRRIHPLIGRDRPWLAPLAGYTDLPFRLLCRSLGAAAACTEMVSAKGLIYGGRNTEALLSTASGDAPLVVQVFGDDPGLVGEAVRRLRERGVEWFDLNAGCPVPKVLKTGSGAALLRDPGRLAALVRAMAEAAGPGRTGVKLRLGWEGGRTLHAELGPRLEEAGAAWLCLHPRTPQQGYGGAARWEAVAELRRAVEVPVLASGDLFSAGDALACLERTGASGVMFARGALRNPLVFAEFTALARGLPAPARTAGMLAEAVRRHVALARSHGRGQRSLLRMRHQAARYLRGLEDIGALRKRLVSCISWEELEEVLEAALAREPAPGALQAQERGEL